MSSGPYAEKELIASGDIEATGESEAVDVSLQKDLTVYINVEAVDGTTPAITFTIQDSVDGETWFDVEAFDEIDAAGTYRKRVEGIGNHVRLAYEVSGTDPVITCDVQAIGRN